jgi:hypothetical protein
VHADVVGVELAARSAQRQSLPRKRGRTERILTPGLRKSITRPLVRLGADSLRTRSKRSARLQVGDADDVLVGHP